MVSGVWMLLCLEAALDGRRLATGGRVRMSASEPVGFAVGIDLGTTSSALAVVEDGTPRVLHAVRSVVRPASHGAFGSPEADGALGEVVGDLSAEGVLASSKRLIGRSFDEAHATLPRHCALRHTLTPLPEAVDDDERSEISSGRSEGALSLIHI